MKDPTECVLSKYEGKNKLVLKCQPVDAKEHMKFGWILEEQPKNVRIGMEDDDSDDVQEQAEAIRKAEEEAAASAPKTPKSAKKGDASINVNGDETPGTGK